MHRGRQEHESGDSELQRTSWPAGSPANSVPAHLLNRLRAPLEPPRPEIPLAGKPFPAGRRSNSGPLPGDQTVIIGGQLAGLNGTVVALLADNRMLLALEHTVAGAYLEIDLSIGKNG